MGTRKSTRGTAWLGIDTSGSMGPKQLSVLEAEARAMCRRGVTVWILQGDTQLCRMEKFRAGASLTQFAGRGGTDFSFFFQKMGEVGMGVKPGFAAFYTDGWGGAHHWASQRKQLMGNAAWESAIAGSSGLVPGTRTPMLWLLTEDGQEPEHFRRLIKFGKVCVVPQAHKEDP
jgi:hypothetical protein